MALHIKQRTLSADDISNQETVISVNGCNIAYAVYDTNHGYSVRSFVAEDSGKFVKSHLANWNTARAEARKFAKVNYARHAAYHEETELPEGVTATNRQQSLFSKARSLTKPVRGLTDRFNWFYKGKRITRFIDRQSADNTIVLMFEDGTRYGCEPETQVTNFIPSNE